MNRQRKRRHVIEQENVHRWLVSYADYMTLMFALFVVLYAMAMVNEKPFESITESFGRVFQAEKDKIDNHGHSLLMVNGAKTNENLYGNGVLEVAGADLLDNEKNLSNVSEVQIGNNLASLEEELHTALYELVESGFVQLHIEGDWLEIELSSGLLFPSGSSSTMHSAKAILLEIYDVIGQVSNFIRIRGYTDNQVINNEIFASNWELSVFRATAILHLLETIGLNPARMAIEGYGQYYPSADNLTAQGRSSNRKVVIAVSRYGLEKANLSQPAAINLNASEKNTRSNSSNEQNIEQADIIKVIRLKNGGIRITTREDNREIVNNKFEKTLSEDIKDNDNVE
ncbi:MAG: flagellar motor protein MotB [Colwellia sp.]